MKLTVTAELTREITDDPRREAVSQRNGLAALGRILRDMSDRIANCGSTSGEFDHNGVSGKFEIEE